MQRFIISLALCVSTLAHAQEKDRASLIDDFLAYRKSGSSIYMPPPITHMVPTFNTITYALSYEKRNITLFPHDSQGEVPEFNYKSLELEGYTVAPHIAISLKKIGLGFSIETSKNSSLYQDGNGQSYSTFQKSEVSASGVGFNVSALPIPSLQKTNKLALILGGKSLNVKHEFSDFQSGDVSDLSEDKIHTVRYNLLKYQLGANLTLQLLKQFAVIPWVDYSRTDTGGAIGAYKDSNYNYDIFEDDIRLYWQSYPNLRYGIDIGINAFGFDVRLGSVLGSLARLHSQPDYIKDSSFSISLSFSQKGG